MLGKLQRSVFVYFWTENILRENQRSTKHCIRMHVRWGTEWV